MTKKYEYHKALWELSHRAREFSKAIVAAAEASKDLAEEDYSAHVAIDECRNALFEAFEMAPGMIQIFTGKTK